MRSPPEESPDRIELRADRLFLLGGVLLGLPINIDLGELRMSVPETAAALVLLLAVSGRQRVKSQKDPLLAVMGLLVLWGCGSAFAALVIAPELPLDSGLVSLAKTAYVFSFALIGRRVWQISPEKVGVILRGFVLPNVFICIWLLGRYATGGLVASWDLLTAREVIADQVPWLGWPGLYASVVAMCAVIAVWQGTRSKGAISRAWSVWLIACFTTVVVISGTRTAWIVYVAALTGLVLTPRYRGQINALVKRSRRLVVALAVVGLLVAEFVPAVARSVAERAGAVSSVLQEIGVADRRVDLWRGTVSVMDDRPLGFILGNGAVGIGHVSDLGQTHNEFVDALFRFGVLGAALVTVLILGQAVRSFGVARTLHSDGVLTLAPALALGGTAYGFTELLTRAPVLGPLFMLMLGIVGAAPLLSEGDQSSALTGGRLAHSIQRER